MRDRPDGDGSDDRGRLPLTGAKPDWPALQSTLDGEVVLPGSPAYDEATTPFNARFHHLRPRAVVRCATPQDVTETISFVTRHGLEAVPRSGGHCFAGRSSTRGVVIDVAPMHAVRVTGTEGTEGIATVGAGARLGDLYEALETDGLTIPGGTCPDVGIAGLTLGGGLGILGRKHGLTCDNLLAAEVVVADGRVLRCDGEHHEDLFWALRGAGAGNLGVVTSFVFRTVPAPRAVNFHVAWPHLRAAAAIEAWQTWAPTGPDELTASLKITTTDQPDQPPSVDVYGAFLGDRSDAGALLGTLVARVGADPSWSRLDSLSFADTRRFWARLPTAGDHAGTERPPEETEHPYFVSKSEFFGRPLPPEAIGLLLETFGRARVHGEARELDFMPWGGAYNRVAAHATAFVHRDEMFQLKHSVVVDPEASTTAKHAALRHVQESWESVHRWGSGRVFPNFADPDLDPWSDTHYGTNQGRLLQVKARYDPDGFFKPPGRSGSAGVADRRRQ